MKKPVILIGVGEMGGVFAKAFLRSGHPVYPINRETDIKQAVKEYPSPEFTFLAVAEKDFHASLDTLPEAWKTKLVLLQNELLPDSWESHGLEDPTIISVWFEKKIGQDVKVLLPSPVFGEFAPTLAGSLAAMDIPTTVLSSKAELVHSLVMKNLFVFTINIAGLIVGGTTGELLKNHASFTKEIFSEVFKIQETLTGTILNPEKLFIDFSTALQADPDHKCQGRSAEGRLNRAIELAKQLEIPHPKLSKIDLTYNQGS